jgi:hypothetical protein
MKQSFYLPRVNLNYEKFNIRFQGADIWNSLDESIKSATLNWLGNISFCALSFCLRITEYLYTIICYVYVYTGADPGGIECSSRYGQIFPIMDIKIVLGKNSILIYSHAIHFCLQK